MAANVLFKKGLQGDLFNSGVTYVKDAFYLTEDSHRLYIGVENGVKLLNSSIACYESYAKLIADTKSNSNQFKPAPGDLAFVEKDHDDDVNALLIYVGGEGEGGDGWVQINAPQDLTALTAAVNKAQEDANTGIANAAAANAAANVADGKAVDAQNTADSALAKAEANGTALGTLTNRVGTAEGNITRISGIVETGNDSNANLRVAISENTTAIATAQSKANDAYTLANTANGKADTNAGNITNINDAIGNDNIEGSIKGRIKVNEGAIADINTAIGADGTSGSIKGRIKANENALAEHGTAITNIQNNYADKTYAEQKASAAETAAKSYADTKIGEAKTALIGTGEIKSTDDTIKGAKKYTDEEISKVNTTITTLKSDIGNISNVMNFRGVKDAVPEVFTGYENGDVIIVDGVEYVYVESEGKFEPFGAATVTEERFEAIEEAAEALTERVTALDKDGTGKIALIEERLDATEDVADGAAAGVNNLNTKVNTLETVTIPGIEAKIGTVAAGQNLASLIAAEETRAKGVEGGLQDAINTINTVTIPGINTAHTTLAGRVTTAEGEIDTLQSEMDIVEGKVSTLETKTGIANLGANENLHGLITAEKERAMKKEEELEAAIGTAIDAALTWGSF